MVGSCACIRKQISSALAGLGNNHEEEIKPPKLLVLCGKLTSDLLRVHGLALVYFRFCTVGVRELKEVVEKYPF